MFSDSISFLSYYNIIQFKMVYFLSVSMFLVALRIHLYSTVRKDNQYEKGIDEIPSYK